MNFTDIEMQIAWNNAALPPTGYNINEYRLDSCRALIRFEDYGKKTKMGWVVDHVYPQNKGGRKHPINLRAMQHENNSRKSDDYPGYQCAVRFSEKYMKNVTCNDWMIENDSTRRELALIYGENAA
jgi:hypothetical protein